MHAGLHEQGDVADVRCDRQTLRHDDVDAEDRADGATGDLRVDTAIAELVDDVYLFEKVGVLLQAEGHASLVGLESNGKMVKAVLSLNDLSDGQAGRRGQAEGRG